MKRGMPSGAQTPDGIIFLLALIFSKAPPRYPPHHGAHWAYTLMDHESNPDMPLLADGKIVFFKTKNSAINFMHNHFRNVSYNDEPAYEFDTETFIKNVRTGYQRGIVIDILNIIFTAIP